MNKSYLQWVQFEGYMAQLEHDIEQHCGKPDMIIGIARGGMPIGVSLSHRFDCDFEGIWATHYDESDNPLSDVRIGASTLDQSEMKEGTVVIVDDIADTGKTMTSTVSVVKSILGEPFSSSFEVVTATIHKRPRSAFEPDVWLHETDEWIVYPWEQDET